jgi:hypothetical protein
MKVLSINGIADPSGFLSGMNLNARCSFCQGERILWYFGSASGRIRIHSGGVCCMQEFIRIVSENPLTIIGIAFVVLLILYFSLMRLVKVALILLIIAVAIGGYFYFKYPEDRPANLGEAVEKTLTETGRAWEKGKEALDKGRELVGKGKEVYEKSKEIVDKGKAALDKGIDKGKGAADEIGKIIGGEKETRSR